MPVLHLADGRCVAEYLTIHGRPEAYTRLAPEEGACYDAMISIDLSRLEPMAALPFHPSEAVTLRELLHDPAIICVRWSSGRRSSSAARPPSPSPTKWWTASWWCSRDHRRVRRRNV